MRELDQEIFRLSLRAEQLLTQLQRLPPGSQEAVETRGTMEIMLQTIEFLKAERARVVIF